jgi:hypothetical protein
MAVKKKSGTTKSAPKKKAATKKASAGTGTKTGTPKAKKTSAKGATKKVKAKKAASVKLTDKQAEFLKTINSAGGTGYMGGKKAEAKALESLLGKKLIKKGAKDKASGAYSYSVSKAGQKHLSTGVSAS